MEAIIVCKTEFKKVVVSNQFITFELVNRQPDFIAELHYLTIDQGGRKKPAFSGYRPQVKFEFSKIQTSGQQKFLNREVVNPGDTVTAEITILSVEFFKNKLSSGLAFDFREGSKIMGTGKILEVLNNELLAK